MILFLTARGSLGKALVPRPGGTRFCDLPQDPLPDGWGSVEAIGALTGLGKAVGDDAVQRPEEGLELLFFVGAQQEGV